MGINVFFLVAGALLTLAIGIGAVEASDAVPLGGLVLAGGLLAWMAATDRLADPPDPRDR